jgi:hypothetical protein
MFWILMNATSVHNKQRILDEFRYMT